jgi:protein SCO1/2
MGELKGKGVLMFFGYTHCPDVCPVTLADFLRVKEALGADADKVAFVLISLDGSRDTPTVLKNYLKSFDPAFIGLTGEEETVRGIITDFAGQFQRQKDTGSAESYLVAHTSFSYFINPDGRWAAAYPFQANPNEIAKDIQAMLK